MTTNFDWADLAFSSKKPVKDLKATFIAAPRELSEKRFKQIIKEYLPYGDIVLGISKEPFVEGFENQPQFKMLPVKTVQKVIDLVHTSGTPYRVYTINYFQRELPFLIEKLGFKRVVLVRGSWRHVFHASPAYYMLMQKNIPFRMISPFADEQEAKAYAKKTRHLDEAWVHDYVHEHFTGKGMLDLANKLAAFSYDYSFQTGAVVGKRLPHEPARYSVIDGSYNEVVPYATYAMHHGTAREDHLAAPNDLNYYDAIHAEVGLILSAQRHKLDLKGTTMFINLMPCPTCARMLARSDIEEFVYSIDHSDGYAVKLFEAAGKKVRRVVP
nr:Cytidine and deoxycytidylate deaminase zinc-binding region [uncultured bacterium]AIA16925.1 Cytidine and deoxycytidylate deaminase zinc-binding region [uncultured bacterium]